jgi:hypothetical protein
MMKEPSTYSVAILRGLGQGFVRPYEVRNRRGRGHRTYLAAHEHSVYEGTVSEATVAQRRTKNRVARKSRRVNRLRLR